MYRSSHRRWFFLRNVNAAVSLLFDARAVSSIDYNSLETLAKKASSDKQPFVRLVITKANLLEMFKHNKYKIHIINDKIPDNSSTTVYRCGPLIDLCYGPHVTHTGSLD